ncbi:DUF6053 domain-containing protein [Lysobacter yananisis]|uniref:DUF6053 domain-containing protein n=1 Tax=Lysobacter yananisis TaxID=1003114 RepID=UPI003CE4927B
MRNEAGGTSVAMRFPAQSAANWNKSIGTEVPPTKAVCAGLRRRRAQSRPTGSKCFCNPAQQAW